MRTLSVVAILGLLAGVWAKHLPNIERPPCDSPEAEEAALLAQDYINSHHSHGYKFILNQIDEFKIIKKPDGGETYLMELDLLETTCHVLDPTPIANCSVRERHLMHIDADCDVVLSKENNVLTMKAFKCKSKKDSREAPCLGCVDLVHLNHTEALEVVKSALDDYNKKEPAHADHAHFALLEVTRLSSQVVSGGPKYFVEFAIVETNCTVDNKESCSFLNHSEARHGFCVGVSSPNAVDVDCRIFDHGPNATIPEHHHHHHHLQHHLHHHTHHAYHPTQSVNHHELKKLHDPEATGLLSESKESAEVPKVKREVVVVPEVHPTGHPEKAPEVLVPLCPGKLRFY